MVVWDSASKELNILGVDSSIISSILPPLLERSAEAINRLETMPSTHKTLWSIYSLVPKCTLVCIVSFVVRTSEDVWNDSLTFAPQFTHQMFGEKETIFGYKNPKIKVHIECGYQGSRYT